MTLAKRKDRKLRAVRLGKVDADVMTMRDEITEMTDVLLGRVDPPINHGLLTLQEVADAYFARASEMTMQLLDLEREGVIIKNSNGYKFRTGTLRVFMEMAKRAADLGSRRITHAALVVEAERVGRESLVNSYYVDGKDA